MEAHATQKRSQFEIISRDFHSILKQIVKSLPSRKCAGPDDWYQERWKMTEHLSMEPIIQLFKSIMFEGRIPSTWRRARLTLLIKGKPAESKSEIYLFRGIASEPTLEKIFSEGVIRRIEYLIENHLPPPIVRFSTPPGNTRCTQRSDVRNRAKPRTYRRTHIGEWTHIWDGS